jgi:hypothetical protein
MGKNGPGEAAPSAASLARLRYWSETAVALTSVQWLDQRIQ